MDSKKSALYKAAYENFDEKGTFKVGPLTSEKMRVDPQYVMFQQARYKHAAKLLEKKSKVFDVGAGDGVGLPILCHYFSDVLAIDIDQHLLTQSRNNLDENFSCDFLLHDFSKAPIDDLYHAGVCFDVMSLIPPENESSWMENVSGSLTKDGMFVIGTQNKNIIHLGNPKNHVDQPNFKDADGLYALMSNYFVNVIMLAMNDEVLHTGKKETCQYLIGVGICPK